MGLLMITAWYPHDKVAEVGKIFLEFNRKNPVDLTLIENLALGTTAEEGGMKILVINKIKKGKYKEALSQAYKRQIVMADGIPGYRYKIEVLMDAAESFALISIKLPE